MPGDKKNTDTLPSIKSNAYNNPWADFLENEESRDDENDSNASSSTSGIESPECTQSDGLEPETNDLDRTTPPLLNRDILDSWLPVHPSLNNFVFPELPDTTPPATTAPYIRQQLPPIATNFFYTDDPSDTEESEDDTIERWPSIFPGGLLPTFQDSYYFQ